MKKTETVAVLGASIKPERYSNKAIKLLLEYGHKVIPVHPKLEQVEKIPVVAALREIKERVDTLTVYLGPQSSERLIEDIKSLNPGRVILNPGTESELLRSELTGSGISVVEACTLVMLRTGQF